MSFHCSFVFTVRKQSVDFIEVENAFLQNDFSFLMVMATVNMGILSSSDCSIDWFFCCFSKGNIQVKYTLPDKCMLPSCHGCKQGCAKEEGQSCRSLHFSLVFSAKEILKQQWRRTRQMVFELVQHRKKNASYFGDRAERGLQLSGS